MSRKVTKKERPSRFLWLGNRLCLDFINTAPVFGAEPVELLDTPRALLGWLREAGVLGRAELEAAHSLGTRAQSAALGDALRLREAIRRGLDEVLRGRRFPAMEMSVLNELSAKPTRQARAHRTRTGWVLQQRWIIEGPGDLLRPLALDTLELVTSPVAARIRRCENAKCLGVFLDTSKAGRRRWCSMSLCGNRAKVAAHRGRRRS